MLVSLGQVVRSLSIDVTDQDALRQADRVWIAADAWVKSYCQRDLEATGYTEDYDAAAEIVLLQYPVQVVTNLWSDPLRVFGPDTLLIEGTDFRLDRSGANGIVRWLPGGRRWFSGWGYGGYGRGQSSVRVEYVAGFAEDAIPADLADAVVRVAAGMYEDTIVRQHLVSAGGAVKSVRRGQSQISYMTAAESVAVAGGAGGARGGGDPYGVRDVLDKYREAVFA